MMDTFNFHNNCNVMVPCYFNVNGVICCVIPLTFSSTPKSLGGITVMLITLKSWKLIICW